MPGLAGGGLPDAEQIITADASGYLRALDEIIRKNDSWINKTREMQREMEKWQRTVDEFARKTPDVKVDVKTDEGFDRRIREMQGVVNTLTDTALAANRKMAEAWDTHADSVHEVATSYEHAGSAVGDFRQHVSDGGGEVRSLSQDMAELSRNAERTAAAIDKVKSSGWTPQDLAAAARANAERSAGAAMPARYYGGVAPLEGRATSTEAQLRAMEALQRSHIVPEGIKNWIANRAYGGEYVKRDIANAVQMLKFDVQEERLFGDSIKTHLQKAAAEGITQGIADAATAVPLQATESGPLQRAIEAVVSRQLATGTMLQRELGIGPAETRRLMSQMEAMGVIGPSLGRGRGREVLQQMADVGAPPIIPFGGGTGVSYIEPMTRLGSAGAFGAGPADRNAFGGPAIWPAFPAGIYGGGGGDRGGGGFAAVAGGFFGAMKPSTIFGNALPTLQVAHLITMFTMEVLSTVIPAAVAAGAAGLVGLQAGQNLYQRGSAMWNAAEALGGTYGGQTLGSMVGLSSNLQQAQDLAQGGVYGIGGAVKDMIGQGGGAFTRMGVQTIAMINRGMASMVIHQRMSQLMDAMGGGTGFLRSFGDIGANLGDTLLNLAPNLPGIGPMLLGGLKGITGFMNMVSGGLPGKLIGAGLAGEAGWRWGKLVLGGMKLPGWLGGAQFKGVAGLADRLGLGALSRTASAADVAAGLAGAEGDMIAGTGLAGLLEASAGPLGLGMALPAWLVSQAFTPGAQKGLQTDMARWKTGIDQSFGAGALTPIKNALYGVTAMQAAEAAGQGPRITDPTLKAGIHSGYYTPQQAYALQQKELGSYAEQFAGQLGNLVAAGPDAVKALNGIGVKGLSLTQAFEMMSMAMISPKDLKGGKLDSVAQQQLKQFAQTYQTSTIGGQPGTATGLLMAGAADYIMSNPAMKSLAQMNQGLDAMTQIMTGGPSGQAALFGMLGGTPVKTRRGGLQLQAPPAFQAMAAALSNVFTPQGAAAWSTFAGPQGLIAAQQANMDQIRTYMTLHAITGRQGAQLGAFDLQQMLPLAAQSPMAQYMLEQQAMQANIPGISIGMGYKNLVKAITGMAPSTAGALGILTQGTKGVADLPAIAASLITGGMGGPSALQSALLNQMAQQGVALAAHPLLKGGGVNVPALSGLVSSLTAGGVSAKDMKISVDAILKNLHVPSNLVAKINAQLNTAQAMAQLNSLKGHQVQAKVNVQGAGELKTLKAEIDALKSKNVQAAAKVQGAGAVAALNAEIAALHSKQVTITTRMITVGGLSGVTPGIPAGVVNPNYNPSAGIPLTAHGQTGLFIPGYGGGDIHPAMLEAGELVVPKHLVAGGAVNHLRGRIPGFQTGGFVGQAAYGPGAYWGMGSQMALWNPALLAALLAAMRAAQGQGVFARPQFRDGAGGGGTFHGGLAGHIFESSPRHAGSQFAVEVLSGIKDGLKKAEAHKLATELINKLEQEVKYATGVANAAAYGQGFDPTGRGSGIFGSMTFTNSAGLTAAQLHSSPTGNIKDYNAYVAAFAAGDPGQAPKSAQQQMQDYLKTLRSFSGDIAKLRKMHLNKDVMAQIIAAGPDQGDKIAQSIMSGKGGVGEVNKLWQQIQKASKGLGAQAAMAQFGGHLSSDLKHGQVQIGGISINVSVAGGGHGGDLQLTPKQIAQIVAQVQAALLRQAKKNKGTGVRLPGKSA